MVSHIFLKKITPILGEDEPILTIIFFKWVGSTTKQNLQRKFFRQSSRFAPALVPSLSAVNLWFRFLRAWNLILKTRMKGEIHRNDLWQVFWCSKENVRSYLKHEGISTISDSCSNRPMIHKTACHHVEPFILNPQWWIYVQCYWLETHSSLFFRTAPLSLVRFEIVSH